MAAQEEDASLVTPEQDDFRRRAVRAALTVVGIAVVLGLVVGGLTAGALYLSGLLPQSESSTALPDADQADSDGSDPDDLPTPSLEPTASPNASPQSTAAPSPSTSPSPTATASQPSPTPAESAKSREPRRRSPIRLHAGQRRAASFERVTLAGRYRGGNGTSLQVQRREGGSWQRFPATATVRAGRFRTYVASGHPGRNAFRVADARGGPVSNVVVVDVF